MNAASLPCRPALRPVPPSVAAVARLLATLEPVTLAPRQGAHPSAQIRGAMAAARPAAGLPAAPEG